MKPELVRPLAGRTVIWRSNRYWFSRIATTGGLGRDVEEVPEFGEKELIIGAFGRAGVSPSLDEKGVRALGARVAKSRCTG
jgi:hypothetical protein